MTFLAFTAFVAFKTIIAFMALNASMGPIGLIAMAIAATLLVLSTNTEVLNTVFNVIKGVINTVTQGLLAFADVTLLAVQVVAKFLGVKGVEK